LGLRLLRPLRARPETATGAGALPAPKDRAPPQRRQDRGAGRLGT